jgi:DNA-binding phage protein
MPLTRDFRETVKARAERDPVFRAGLYQEALQALLDGEFGTAKILLRDVINATVGFAQLGQRIGLPEKSLMRMFGPNGNPRADNLVAVVAALKDECRLSLTVHAAPCASGQVARSGPPPDGGTRLPPQLPLPAR